MRTRICDASLAIVTTEGFEALTMPRLGRELECAAGGIYRYFPSKSAIVMALLHRAISGFVTDFMAARDRMTASRAVSKLEEGEQALVCALLVFETYVGLWARRPTHMQLITLALGDPKNLVEDPENGDAEAFAALASVAAVFWHATDVAVREGMLRAGHSEHRLLTLMGALHGALQLRKMERLESFRIDAEVSARDVMDAMFVSWGADADALAMCHRHARRIAADAAKEV